MIVKKDIGISQTTGEFLLPRVLSEEPIFKMSVYTTLLNTKII